VKKSIVIALLLVSGLAFAKTPDPAPVSGTALLTDIVQYPEAFTNPGYGLMTKEYHLRVTQEAEAMDVTAVCQDNIFSRCPTDFVTNDSVSFRLEKKILYLTRANGKEVKTKVVGLRKVQ
jgi:hypothetical protein